MTSFCKDLNISLAIIRGAMYPCSNPELVAAVSEAGSIGMVQPLSRGLSPFFADRKKCGRCKVTFTG
ncbi:hypothetical protein HQ531_13175 [bacterium]|nr:hypothetical protein [bacterium]